MECSILTILRIRQGGGAVPDDFQDEYQARLRDAITKKIQGQEIVTADTSEPGNVIDLMEALQKCSCTVKKHATKNKTSHIYILHDNFHNDKENRNEQVDNCYFTKHAQWKIHAKMVILFFDKFLSKCFKKV